MKILKYKVAGVLQQDETGAPAQVGDQVKMFLDTSANPELPEFVFGIIQPGIRKAGCCEDYTIYKIGYELEDYTLRSDDVISLTTTAAVDVVAQNLLEETERAIAAETSLDNLKAPKASPVFTGNPTAPTPTTTDNDTSIATTAFVQAQPAVRYTVQTLTSGEQEQARANVGMVNRTLTTSTAGSSVDWENRRLYNTSGDISINYGGSRLEWAGNPVLDWTGGGLSIPDSVDFFLGSGAGTKFGMSVSQKLSFHNATPTVQRASANQAEVATTALTVSNPPTQAEVQAIVTRLAAVTTLVNELRNADVEKGLIKGSA